MNTAEMMGLYKLEKYRDKSSKRERFILPENEDISIFTNVFDEACDWFNNIENIVVDKTSPNLDDKTSNLDDEDKSNIKTKFKNNSVYLLTSKFHQDKRTYIIGKSKNLNSRLSAYNKGVYHDVIYHKSFENKQHMDIIELMILYKLDNCRERLNRDRFILPDDKDVNLFKDILIISSFFIT